jgi:hypothetical protein
MKRAIYEWGWMLSAAAAVGLLILWVVSTFSSFTIEPFDLDGKTYAGLSGGTAFCSSMDDRDRTLHLYWPDLAVASTDYDDSESIVNFKAPGFRFRRDERYSDDPFAVEMSLLIPASVVGFVSVTFGMLLWRYRRRVMPARKAAA